MTLISVVMVPGGLYEDMDATRFWVEPGVSSALQLAGFEVTTVDRPRRPRSWTEEGSLLAEQIHAWGRVPAAVVAGSNGCSAAVRLAIDHHDLVGRLVLCWPATANDERVDSRLRKIIEHEVGPGVADVLLRGGTLRGVADDELKGLDIPVTVIPSKPENPFHRRTTIDALGRLLPDVRIAAAAPESPRPEFPAGRSRFVNTLIEALR